MAAESWKQLAATLAQMGLPVLGRVLGGQIPIIGGIIGSSGGEAVGRIVAQAIASALGVKPTPEAIGNAIENGETSEVMAQLRTVEAEAAARWPAVATITASDNTAEVEVAKINAESSARIAEDMGKNDGKYSFYRVILMWVATADLTVVFGVVKYALFALLFGNGEPLQALSTDGVWQLLTLDTGIAGTILGWHFFTRGKERAAAVSAPAQAAAQAAANAVARK